MVVTPGSQRVKMSHLSSDIVQSPQGCSCGVGMEQCCALTKFFLAPPPPPSLKFLDPPPSYTISFKAKSNLKQE